MIQINELRVGNLIQEGKVEQIDNSIDEIYYSGDGYYLSNYCCNLNAIPLTEEWLLKFGFKRFPWGLVIGELLFKDNLKCTELTFEVGNGFRVELKYVHHLQNFYFDFNNEELKQQ